MNNKLLTAGSDKPLVSVVISNYNGIQYNAECVRSVLNTTYPDIEVIFVDNGSEDESFKVIGRLFGHDKRLKMVRLEKNKGCAGGNNVGAKNSVGQHVCFLSNDTKVDPSWLIKLLEVLENDSAVGAVQGKILQLFQPTYIDTAGQFLDYLGYSYTRGNEVDAGQYSRVAEIFYADGAALLIKRNVMEEISVDGSPFDPDYAPAYYEDTDLCWRIRLGGYKILFVPNSIVYHARQGSQLYKMPQHVIFSHSRNRIMSLIKNYEIKNIAKFLPPLLLLEFARAITLLKGKPFHSLATMRAILWNIRNLKKVWRKRLVVQQLRRVSDSHIKKAMRKPSILYLVRSLRKYYLVTSPPRQH